MAACSPRARTLWLALLSVSIDPLEAAILGALQGITEFLPVSSSGHIAVAEALFEVENASLALTVLLHVGTLAATIWLFRGDLLRLTRDAYAGLRSSEPFRSTESGRTVSALLVAMVPTIVLALMLRQTVEAWSHQLPRVGVCFLGSAVAVLLTLRKGGRKAEVGLWAALAIGTIQGLAALPGLSRSGTTIAVAMLAGAREEEAFRFSFLLSIPAVFAATVWELSKVKTLDVLGIGGLIGASVAFVVGYASLLLLRRLLIAGRFWWFTFYLVPLGLGLIFFGFGG